MESKKLMPETKRKLVEIPIDISLRDLLSLVFARPQKMLIDIEYEGNPKIYEVSLRNRRNANEYK